MKSIEERLLRLERKIRVSGSGVYVVGPDIDGGWTMCVDGQRKHYDTLDAAKDAFDTVSSEDSLLIIWG